MDSATVRQKSVRCRLWTSTLKRTKETCQFMRQPLIQEEGQPDWMQARAAGRRVHHSCREGRACHSG